MTDAFAWPQSVIWACRLAPNSIVKPKFDCCPTMCEREEKRRFCVAMFRVVMAVAVVLSLSNCGKIDLDEYLDDDESGKYTVRFSVSEYDITDFEEASSSAKAMRKGRKEARELGSVLNFAVFQDGKKVESVNQKSTDSDFGNIAVSLSEGSYQVVVVIHSGSGNATVSSPEKVTFPGNKVTDTFAYCSDLEVEGSCDNTITVDRVVAKYRLTVADDIPDEVKTIRFQYTGGSSTLNPATGFGCVDSRQKEERDVSDHAAGQVFEVYTFPHDTSGSLKLTVTALNKSGETVSEHVFEDVPVELNKVTTHTKTFFGGGSGGTIEGDTHVVIGGDDTWTGEINY